MYPWTWFWLKKVTQGDWLQNPTHNDEIFNITTDSRIIPPRSVFLALKGDRLDGHDFIEMAIQNGAMGIIVQRVPAPFSSICGLLVKDTLIGYQRIAKEHRLNWTHGRMVGVTGSFGKTTTKELIASILSVAEGPDYVLATKGNTNNQIGVPQNLLRLRKDHRLAVLEMGTNQPGEIAQLTDLVRPDIAVLTGVGPAHLEKLGGIDGVKREKRNIFQYAHIGILPVSLFNDPIIRESLPSSTMSFGMIGTLADIQIGIVSQSLKGGQYELVTSKGRFRFHANFSGQHMALNAAAASAVGISLGYDLSTIVQGLSHYRPGAMRMEIKIDPQGIVWVNDAYNANPQSVRALIEWLVTLEEWKRIPWIVVLGDMLELGESSQVLHQEIADYARTQLKDAKLIFYGDQYYTILKNSYDLVFPFSDFDRLQQLVYPSIISPCGVVIKGSRRMALERLLPNTSGVTHGSKEKVTSYTNLH